MKTPLLILLLTAFCSTGFATPDQSPIRLTGAKKGTDTQVIVENLQVVRSEQRLLVAMDFILDSLEVPSNRYRAFTPVIRSTDGQHEQRMKTLIVSGRRQNIVFERDGIDPLYAANCENVRRTEKVPQTYHYNDATETLPWFDNANVYVDCDLCGCGDTLKNEHAFLAPLEKPVIDPYDVTDVTDIVPPYAKKERNLHGSAYITFVVDRWEVKPDYMSNRRELRKITDTLDVMVADPNCSVRQVKIHGWASPESPYEHNKMLAENRAKSLTEYVSHLYNLPADVFAPAEATPENWIGLREAVEKMDEQTLPHRTEILDKINKVLADLGNNITKQADRDEHAIRDTYPAEYRYLLQNVYPGLRRSDYDISFNFSDFTLEQAKEVYKKRPYQLSLRELWDVAHTMEPNSKEYDKVMQQAVIIYPDDPVANLNLANIAIRERDVLKAETLLDRAGDSAEAINSRAVVAIIQKRYDEATRLLDAAEKKGLNVTKNREAIRLLTK